MPFPTFYEGVEGATDDQVRDDDVRCTLAQAGGGIKRLEVVRIFFHCMCQLDTRLDAGLATFLAHGGSAEPLSSLRCTRPRYFDVQPFCVWCDGIGVAHTHQGEVFTIFMATASCRAAAHTHSALAYLHSLDSDDMSWALLFAASGALVLPPATPRVWDSVFSPAALQTLIAAGCDRTHSFTSVLDRKAWPAGRTAMEVAILSLLDELGDESRFVEYWYRDQHKDLSTHRDVDEALCRSRKHAGTQIGVQRCPSNGHVLYLDVAPGLHGPTCVWEEVDPDDAWSREAAAAEADVRAGPPRELSALHVVPAIQGRLLRFRGDQLHAVPKPALSWLEEGGDEDEDAARSSVRRVILFNTWHSQPPMLPSPNEPPPRQAAEAFAVLSPSERPVCQPRTEWQDAVLLEASAPPMTAPPSAQGHPNVATTRASATMATLVAPLLGDEALRRGCEEASLVVRAPAAVTRSALTSESAPYSIAVVEDVGAATRLPSAFASAAGVAPWQRQDQEPETVARV